MQEKYLSYDENEPILIALNEKYYSLTNCKWMNRYSNKKKDQNYPTKRYNHAGVMYNNYLYVFGGTEKQTDFDLNHDCVYKLNINNWIWEKIVTEKHPKVRDSHGYCVNKDRMIIFGGSDHQFLYNDLWAFNFLNNQWTQLEQKDKKPIERDSCHLINFNQNFMFLMGGINVKLEMIFNDVQMYSFESFTWQQIQIINAPSKRINQAYTKCQDKIYMFGGYQLSKNERFLNDLYQMNINTDQKKIQYRLIGCRFNPSGRCSHKLIQFGSQYLILIGGEGEKQEYQQKQKIIQQQVELTQKQNDQKANKILKQSEKDIQVQNQIQKTNQNQQNQSKEKQQQIKEKQIEKQTVKSKETRLKIKEKDLKEKLKDKAQKERLEKQKADKQRQQKQKLEKEKAMKQLELQNQKKRKQQEQKKQQQRIRLKQLQKFRQEQQINAKNDVWAYSIQKKLWIQIQPKNAQFRPRLSFSLTRYENRLLLFGGMRKTTNLYDQLMILTFQQEQPLPKQDPCQVCLAHEKQQKQQELIHQCEKYSEFLPIMSNNFIYNIALLQNFAFNAIGLILDGSILMRSDYVRVAIRKRIGEFSFIAVQFDGDNLTNRQFLELMNNRQIEKNKINEFANNIKFGSFRLGRTFLYINRSQNIIRVSLFSVNSNIMPNCEFKYKSLGYIQNIQTNFFLTEFGSDNKKHIVNFLSSQVQDYRKLLQEPAKHSIYIFQMNLIMTSKNVYYYELILNSPDDIRVLINHRKIDFLDQIGYNISQQPDVSLASYLSLLYLNSNLKIYLNENTTPVQFFNYKQHLETFVNNHNIQNLNYEQTFIEAKEMKLYRVHLEEQPIKTNLGLLIYQNGRLIMRFGTEFGNLFSDKFFKNKYKKKRFHIFKTLGIIELNQSQMKANIVKTDFQNNQYAIPFWSKLKNILKDQKSITRAFQITQEEDQVIKKIKL